MGTGPGEFGVLEGGIMRCSCRKARGRHDDKNDMPQGGSYHGRGGGSLRSTQHSLKKLPSRKFLGTRVQVRTAAMAAADALVEGAPGDIEFSGLTPVSRRTGLAAGLAAWPKRLNAPLMWFRDICFFRQPDRGAVKFWGPTTARVLPTPVGIMPTATTGGAEARR